MCLLQVYKIYARYFAGLLRWYKPPPGTVFNVALFTGWEAAFLEKIPPGWQRIKAKAMFKFMAWLIPRPKLFKYLEVRQTAPYFACFRNVVFVALLPRYNAGTGQSMYMS